MRNIAPDRVDLIPIGICTSELSNAVDVRINDPRETFQLHAALVADAGPVPHSDGGRRQLNICCFVSA